VGLHLQVFGIFLLFLITLGTAFPHLYNAKTQAFNWPQLPDSGYRLGLDLQGGAHLVYEADMSAIAADDRAAALEGVRDVIERRVNAFGVSEPIVLTNASGGHYQIIVELAGLTDVSAAVEQIGETPILEFKIPDKDIQVEATPEQEAQAKEAQVGEREAAMAVLDKAVSGEDFTSLGGEYVGVVTSEDKTFGELAKQIQKKRYKPGVINALYESGSTIHVINYLGRKDEEQAQLSHILICYAGAKGCTNERTQVEAQLLAEDLLSQANPTDFAQLAKDNSNDPGSGSAGGDLGWVKKGQMIQVFEDAGFALKDGGISSVVESEFGYHIIYRRDTQTTPGYEISHIEMPWTTVGDLLVIDPWQNTELSGKNLRSAAVAFDQQTGSPFVQISFDDAGAEIFGQLTEEHVGEVIGIFLDGSAISTPMVQQAIYGGTAQITGNFTLAEAKLLAQRLNAGALPVPVELVSQQTVGPSLGQISLEMSVEAALYAFALVAIFMIIYYRLPGLVSVLALGVYATVNLALFKWLGVTITLSGIAGFIFSIGIAVDANVLIFERLKEELQSGRDLPTALDEGFRRAWTSIRDGHATTLISSIVLFAMSTSFVKGFALTLTIGIIISLLSAVLFTRAVLQWLIGWKFLRAAWLYHGSKKN
jgi:protein-export membrane protein SecD